MVHYILKFRGSLYQDIEAEDEFPHDVKSDGYCHIKGHRSTQHPEGMETIRQSLCKARYYGSDDVYIRYEYRIDSKDYVILEDKVSSGNKFEFYAEEAVRESATSWEKSVVKHII